MKISVTNRQRALPVNVAEFKQMVESVAISLCQNLKSQPAKGWPLKLLQDLDQRGEVSFVLVSNTTIKKLNREWRGIDHPTDVLSFSIDEGPPPERLPWELGEIFISMQKADEQANALNHSLRRELAFLCAHGFLHLLGFDHETAEEEKLMFARQHEILLAAGFPRE